MPSAIPPAFSVWRTVANPLCLFVLSIACLLLRVYPQAGKTRFHKSQMLTFHNEVSNIDVSKPGIGAFPLPCFPAKACLSCVSGCALG